MTDLEQLLADLKAAERGSNALDVRLDILVNPLGTYTKSKRLNAAGTKVICTYNDDTHGTRYADDFTTDVDAALRLLRDALPGYDWVLGHTNGGLTIHAQVGPNEQVFGDTPALALCTAIVEAKIKEGAQ